MSDRCFSTLICARADRPIFEKLGYKADDSQALTVDGNEIPDVLVMVDEEAAGGNYDELTALKGIPFLVSNTGCSGAYGDYLLVSDGENSSYTEALHESNYPAVRVNRDGVISKEDMENARQYWRVYAAVLEAFKRRPAQTGGDHAERS